MFDCTCTECGKVFPAKTAFKKICGPSCTMKKHRRSDSGKASYQKQLDKAKKRRRKQICECCKKVFKTARKIRYLCDECVPDNSLKFTQDRFRKNNRWSKKGG